MPFTSLKCQSHQILTLSCPLCKTEFAVAHHTVYERDDNFHLEYHSEIHCGGDDCNHSSKMTSEQSMHDAMKKVWWGYLG